MNSEFLLKVGLNLQLRLIRFQLPMTVKTSWAYPGGDPWDPRVPPFEMKNSEKFLETARNLGNCVRTRIRQKLD